MRAMADPDYDAQKAEKFAMLAAAGGRGHARCWPIPSSPRPGRRTRSTRATSCACKMNGLDAEAYRVKLLNDYGVGVISTSDTDIRVAHLLRGRGATSPTCSTSCSSVPWRCVKAEEGWAAASGRRPAGG